MIYVTSDIHGCYDEFMLMLNKINFSSTDTLYVLGDTTDRGDKPIDVLLHCLLTDNIKLLCGNHEWFLFENAEYLTEPWEKDQAAIYRERYYTSNWRDNGGYSTAKQFMKLSTQDRQFILDSIKRLPLYFEVSVNHVNYVMVHGGLGDYFFDASKKLSRYKRDDFIWSRLEPSKKYYSNKSIIVGHTPTPNLTVRHTSEIVCSNGNYWIDCGCVFGYKLACLCLNTLEEFYVDKLK